jgi:predicted alpha/beta-fold hydrolase
MIINSEFKPAWWLAWPHLQTIWPVLFRRKRKFPITQEQLELPDGDLLDLAWIGDNSGPLVLVLHGLEGSIRSHYAERVLATLYGEGFRPVFMHFRGCGKEPNRLPRGYHSGETGDLNRVLQYIGEKTGQPVAAAIGYSLGGNVLLKWLGEQGEASTLQTAVAVSVPFNLNDCALRLELGGSRIYREYLLRQMRSSYKRKFRRIQTPLKVDVDKLNSFREFDDQITAPLHGFRDVDHYYSESSSRRFIKRIATPTLILQARDDPFMFAATIPRNCELPPAVTIELSARGGHVGFIHGPGVWCAGSWLEERIIRHLRETL